MFTGPVFTRGPYWDKSMEAVLSLWDLDAANQICLTTDNGSNIVNPAGVVDWSMHWEIIIHVCL